MTWQERALGDCVTFASGGTPNKGKPEYWNGEIPWVSSGEMSRHFIEDTSLHITEAGAQAGSRLVPAGTVFAVVRGMSLATEFRLAYATRTMAFNQDVKALTVKDGIDSYFLFSSLRAHANQIRDLSTEAAHGTKKLEMERLASFRIPVPEVGAQRRAADVVRHYDDLLEANRRRIALLEESARLLYREWFVNLRFPEHELELMTNGLPAGWIPRPLAALVDTNPKTQYERDKAYPFVSMQALSETLMVIGPAAERRISGGAKCQNRDTLLARITPCLENGKTGFVQFLSDDSLVASGSTEFIVMRSKTVSPYWVYCLAREQTFREHAIRSMTGADGRQRVNARCFDTYMTLQPPEAVLKEFDAVVEPIFQQVEVLARQNLALQEARDELLPKLMSGAIQV